jgi:hypothetical protein
MGLAENIHIKVLGDIIYHNIIVCKSQGLRKNPRAWVLLNITWAMMSA